MKHLYKYGIRHSGLPMGSKFKVKASYFGNYGYPFKNESVCEI